MTTYTTTECENIRINERDVLEVIDPSKPCSLSFTAEYFERKVGEGLYKWTETGRGLTVRNEPNAAS